MNLLKLLGYAKSPSREQIGDEGMAALISKAELALRAGVVITPEFWAGCEDYEREALALAGDRVFADRAVLIGIACSGPRGMAQLTVHRDGGATLQAIEDMEEQARNAASGAQSLEDFGFGDVATDSALTRLPDTKVTQ